MKLEKAYENWKKSKVDEHLHMVNKKRFKKKRIQLWNRKLEAWNIRKEREKENA